MKALKSHGALTYPTTPIEEPVVSPIPRILVMEYDQSTAQGTPEAKKYPHETEAGVPGHGHRRVKGDAVTTSSLAEPLTFPFSGKTAKNRFLKAPMTERLCHWNKEGEDIVSQTLRSVSTRIDKPFRALAASHQTN